MVVADRDVGEFQCRVCNAEAYEELVPGETKVRTKDPGTVNSAVVAITLLAWINQFFCENCAQALNFCYRLELLPGGRFAQFSGKVLAFIKFLEESPEARRPPCVRYLVETWGVYIRYLVETWLGP
jgi:hypothetical protein